MHHLITQKYAAKIAAISDEYIHENGIHQISIDLVEDFQQDFIIDRDEENDPITPDEISGERYKISLVLEVMDREKYPVDEYIFEIMYNLLEDWEEELIN